MLRRLLLVPLIVLLVSVPSWADVGVFTNDESIGNDGFIGSTVNEGNVGVALTQQYLITGGGHDIWDGADDFQYAYREVSGDVRISASFSWVEDGDNDWAKMGVMLRESNADNSVHYSTFTRGAKDYVGMQYRPATGSGSSQGNVLWPGGGTTATPYLGIAVVDIGGGLKVLESTYDIGNGWEFLSQRVALGLPDDLLGGVAVTSHDADYLVQARASDVRYESDPVLLGGMPEFPLVPADAAKDDCPEQPGFKIRSIKATFTDGWGYGEMNKLLDYGCTGPFCTGPGMPIPGIEEGSRIDPVVNLRDTGNGAFGDDRSYPGIDPFVYPAGDPAAGDDDNNFATEILACIQLTEGIHIIGANSDDGTIIEIGGVEVARTGQWKGASNQDFIYEVEADGFYSLRARTLEGGGGASIELHEIVDGNRILLGDVANGGSPVFIPEPATIALLGLGGLALVRVRRKS